MNPAPGPAFQAVLSSAADFERKALDQLLSDAAWPRRAIAAVRLERYACEQSRDLLARLLQDESWQVRAFAIRSLGRRRIPQQHGWFDNEHNPRVIRAAVRYRYDIEPERLARGVRLLCRSNDLGDKMLGVEIAAAAVADKDLQALARETLTKIIVRMDRIEGGVLSPRLAAVTGQPDMRRQFRWQQWLRQAGRTWKLQPAFSVPPGDGVPELSPLAALEPEAFTGLDAYMQKLGQRSVDLAICLDCTASMGGELAAAQGGIDDLMLFVRDMIASLRVGMTAYRDRQDDFETRWWDFTSDIAQARAQLWQLSADGGGDSPESVYAALRDALTKLNWRPASTKVLVLVGDAPPHVGHGGLCVELARQAHAQADVTTHVIQTKGKAVKHFPEIAEAGGGRCVSLTDRDALIAEIAGLTLSDRYGDEFRDFFSAYLELCR